MLYSAIDSDISLSTDKLFGGNFKVHTITSNSHVNIKFLDSPIDSVLDCLASTSNSPAFVELHPTFEGKLLLVTSNALPTLESREVEDPAGEGRERNMQIHRMKAVLEGTVQWGFDKKPLEGFVNVKTSNSPIRVKV